MKISLVSEYHSENYSCTNCQEISPGMGLRRFLSCFIYPFYSENSENTRLQLFLMECYHSHPVLATFSSAGRGHRIRILSLT